MEYYIYLLFIKMKFKICNSDTNDYFILEGSLEDIRINANNEVNKRGWKNYFSELIKND